MAGYGKSLAQALSAFTQGGGPSQAQIQGELDGSRAFAQDANGQQSLAQALKAQAETTQLQPPNRAIMRADSAPLAAVAAREAAFAFV